jgi:hypothetical protein
MKNLASLLAAIRPRQMMLALMKIYRNAGMRKYHGGVHLMMLMSRIDTMEAMDETP